MFIALDEKNNRIAADEAKKGEKYFCPVCQKEVIPKQGEIKLWHYAHKNDELCLDNWNYDMSEWHKKMQSYFPLENREILLKKDGVVHRADILKDGIVVEFQHSAISSEEFCDRNNFYSSLGYKIAWVFDVSEEYKNEKLYYYDNENENLMRWKWAKSVLRFANNPNDNDKQMSTWLYLGDDSDADYLYKVIWSSKSDDDSPNYKYLAVSNYQINISSFFEMEDFFTSGSDLLNKHLSKYQNYKIIYCGERGHSKDEYVCPKTQKFGVRLGGENGCSYCAHCAAISQTQRKKRTYRIYCCYPQEVNKKLEEPFDGFYYESAKRFYI